MKYGRRESGKLKIPFCYPTKIKSITAKIDLAKYRIYFHGNILLSNLKPKIRNLKRPSFSRNRPHCRGWNPIRCRNFYPCFISTSVCPPASFFALLIASAIFLFFLSNSSPMISLMNSTGLATAIPLFSLLTSTISFVCAFIRFDFLGQVFTDNLTVKSLPKLILYNFTRAFLFYIILSASTLGIVPCLLFLVNLIKFPNHRFGNRDSSIYFVYSNHLNYFAQTVFG